MTGNEHSDGAPVDKFEAFWNGPGSGLADGFQGSGSESLSLDYETIWDWDRGLAMDYLDSPETMRKMAEKALRKTAGAGANVRLTNIPDDRHFRVGDYRTDQLGELIAVSGEVVSVNDTSPLINHAVFECIRCGESEDRRQFYGDIVEPVECSNCEMKGPWDIVRSESKLIDFQCIVLIPDDTSTDDPPTATVYLRRDLVESVGEGDEVTIVGKFDTLPLSLQSETELNTFVETHAIESKEDTERDKLPAEEVRDLLYDYVADHEDGTGAHGVRREEVVAHVRDEHGIREKEIEDRLDELDGSKIIDNSGTLMTMS